MKPPASSSPLLPSTSQLPEVDTAVVSIESAAPIKKVTCSSNPFEPVVTAVSQVAMPKKKGFLKRKGQTTGTGRRDVSRQQKQTTSGQGRKTQVEASSEACNDTASNLSTTSADNPQRRRTNSRSIPESEKDLHPDTSTMQDQHRNLRTDNDNTGLQFAPAVGHQDKSQPRPPAEATGNGDDHFPLNPYAPTYVPQTLPSVWNSTVASSDHQQQLTGSNYTHVLSMPQQQSKASTRDVECLTDEVGDYEGKYQAAVEQTEKFREEFARESNKASQLQKSCDTRIRNLKSQLESVSMECKVGSSN